MYFRQLKLKNFRCFTNATLDLPLASKETPQRNVTVLVGDSGSGKSTLLQAITLGLLGEELRDGGLLLQNLVRQGMERSTLMTIWDDGETKTIWDDGEAEKLNVKIEQKGKVHYPVSVGTSHATVLAYGVHRRAPPGGYFHLERMECRYTPKVQRVMSLFTDEADHVDLIPRSEWVKHDYDTRYWAFGQMIQAIPDFFPNAQLGSRGDAVGVFRKQQMLDFQLPLGHRKFLAWFNDMLYRLVLLGYPKAVKPVVVLVDEVDMHMHPRWQQTVINGISAALPDVQFIFTTQSPLVVGSVHRERLRFIQKGVTRDKIEIPAEPTYGLTPDQLLLGGLFGLQSLRIQEDGT